MSQPSTSASSSVPTSAATSSSDIERIFDTALESYKRKTKEDLKDHELFKMLEKCDSPAAILAVFQATQFGDPSRTGSGERLRGWLVPTLNVLCTFSNTLGEGVSLAFGPAKTVFAGVGVLLLAAKDVAASQDILIDIFGRIESFFVRLEIYTDVPLTPPMTKKMVQITVETLDILATATKEMKKSAASGSDLRLVFHEVDNVPEKFLKRVMGWTDLEDGLKKLEKLTNEEIAMAIVQQLKVSHDINENVLTVKSEVQLVKDNVKAVDDQVQTLADDGMATAIEVKLVLQKTIDGVENMKVVNDNVLAVDDRMRGMADECKETAKEVKVILQHTANGVDDVKRNQLRESLRKWLSPPDPSTNHHIVGDRQHEGTAEWFMESDKCHKWKADGSLLWIHGKAGSGKSVLCSAIINDVTRMCKIGSASMAYFYFDFRDLDKQSRRNLLPSLLVQLTLCSNAFCDILSRLYTAHDNGARQASDKDLTQCLKDMLTLPDQRPVYLIIDALDECPNTSDIPSARKRVLDLIKDLVNLRLPNLRICVTSRPEVDIGEELEPLASETVSLETELGQKKDISDYVRSIVYSGSGTFMKRWREEDKEHVIETLSERADGM
ncbi:hypothetical protein V8E53_005778 [Lactarius tabidus]